jgi:hypothetical protein
MGVIFALLDPEPQPIRIRISSTACIYSLHALFYAFRPESSAEGADQTERASRSQQGIMDVGKIPENTVCIIILVLIFIQEITSVPTAPSKYIP